MKSLVISILVVIGLAGCAGESDIKEEDFDSLSEEVQTLITENASAPGVYVIDREEDKTLVVAFAEEGAQVSASQETENQLAISVDEPQNGGEDIHHIYSVDMSLKTNELIFHFNGTETPADGVFSAGSE